MTESKKYHRLGFIGRFKPLHLGGYRALEALCEHAEHAIIGIGSANRYDMRNPFTSKESEVMIRLALSKDNYSIIHIPDYGHLGGNARAAETQWIGNVRDCFGSLDAFVTGNPYVALLLEPHYQIIHPSSIISHEKQITLDATTVRAAIAHGKEWDELVPQKVADYLRASQLDQRFRSEFGPSTIAAYERSTYQQRHNLAAEQAAILNTSK